MGLDRWTRYAIDETLSSNNISRSELTKDVLFIGYPSLMDDDDDFDENYLTHRFDGWSCVDISGCQNCITKDFCNESLGRKYSLIIDHGSIQHFYDPFKGILNTIRHIKDDGFGIHILTCDGNSGFGYYQISPQIFTEFERNGFVDIKHIRFITDVNDKYYYEADKNDLGEFYLTTRARVIVVYKKKQIDSNNDIESVRFYQEEFNTTQLPIYRWRQKKTIFRTIKSRLNVVLVVLYEMITGRLAFWYRDNKKLKRVRAIG